MKRERRRLHKINNEITHSQVRIVGDNIESKICSLSEALEIALNNNVDLVEINSSSIPVICKIVDYNKFLYTLKKNKSNSKKSQTKEIILSPNIGEHDLNFKINNGLKHLEDGNKLKLTVRFKGREIIYKEQGELVLLTYADKVKNKSKVEQLPKLLGKNMIMMLSPKN